MKSESALNNNQCKIKVIGIGGGGGNAINRMMETSHLSSDVELWVVNTDAQAITASAAPHKLNIGKVLSR
jgi:cell division protein FtsZ